MLTRFFQLPENKWFWLVFIGLGLGLDGMALFYQYVLDYMPCVLCIHTRIWVVGMILVSLLALAVYQSKWLLRVMQFLLLVISVGLLDRAYQLLGVERGFIFGNCSMASGLPSWFALDEWVPALFQVWEPCGYTPELLFGVTMAEALIVLSATLVMLTTLWFIGLFLNIKK